MASHTNLNENCENMNININILTHTNLNENYENTNTNININKIHKHKHPNIHKPKKKLLEYEHKHKQNTQTYPRQLKYMVPNQPPTSPQIKMDNVLSVRQIKEGYRNSPTYARDHYGGGGGIWKASSFASCCWMACWLLRMVAWLLMSVCMSALRASMS